MPYIVKKRSAKMTKLLNIDSNAKTIKGQPHGYMTAVMYLAPFKSAGINVCPMAELAGCVAGCLNTAGRGGIAKDRARFNPHGVELPDNAIQRARIKRTRLFADDRAAFLTQLVTEIAAFVRKAERKGLTPCVRLNGTSDIRWENERFVWRTDGRKPFAQIADRHTTPDQVTVFDLFPDLVFYDYTKLPNRFERELPANYHLSLSYSEASERYKEMCIKAHNEHRASLIFVVRDAATKARCLTENIVNRDMFLVDGDEHDLRFLDAPGSLVYLKAKGSARRDDTGFVLD